MTRMGGPSHPTASGPGARGPGTVTEVRADYLQRHCRWRPGIEPCLGQTWSRDYPVVISRPTPTLPDANLRYQDALYWRKWTTSNLKGGWDFPFCPRSFEKAVMVQ